MTPSCSWRNACCRYDPGCTATNLWWTMRKQKCCTSHPSTLRKPSESTLLSLATQPSHLPGRSATSVPSSTVTWIWMPSSAPSVEVAITNFAVLPSSVASGLDRHSLECLTHAFISSRLDNGNALLCGLNADQFRRLQLLQNSTARMLTRTPRRDHITPVLQDLHWLPVKARVQYKVLLLTFKCIHNLAPSYLCDILHSYVPNRDLRSADSLLLNVPFTHSNRCSQSAFSYYAPKLWNSLPSVIRNAPSLQCFKTMLKTHLFQKFYGPVDPS